MFKFSKTAISTALLASLALTAPAFAQQGHIKMSSKAMKIIKVRDPSGQLVQKQIPATKVLPGEIVQYTTLFTNISATPAGNINITNPIPKHTVYLPNTANGHGSKVYYSVDGGKNWGIPAQLKVRQKNGQWRAARTSDYTHIRWAYQGNLAPKTQKTVNFRVKLL